MLLLVGYASAVVKFKSSSGSVTWSVKSSSELQHSSDIFRLNVATLEKKAHGQGVKIYNDVIPSGLCSWRDGLVNIYSLISFRI